MPNIKVVYYRDDDGSTPLSEWLDEVQPRAAVPLCIRKIDALRELGHELRRPHTDILADGIYELRAHLGRVQLRMLYFYANQVAVITHGFFKRGDKVPTEEIERAKRFRDRYQADPDGHTNDVEE